MYVPNSFAEKRIDVLHDFMHRHDFATVISGGPAGSMASHVPMILIPDRGRCGALQFHLARPNEQVAELVNGSRTLAIFQGPHGYVSPRWYKTPITVPTWNYIVVHASGTPRTLSDGELATHLQQLVATYERGENAWSQARLPADALKKLQSAVVGFELEIVELQGKWKLGQNRTREDREGAIAGLRAAGTSEADALADAMAAALKDAMPQ